MRTPVAYPVYLSQYEAQRRQFSRSTGVRGLYSVGRNGEFAHLLMEDVHTRTLRRTAALAASLEEPSSSPRPYRPHSAPVTAAA